MTLPLVTAAFTTYNAARTIHAALESALKQDWPALEILVVDDGSTDETVDVVTAFMEANAESGREMRLLRQPRNSGVAEARNRLIAEAAGTFIAFFDDDDISAPDRVSKQYARIVECEKAYSADLVVCHTAREQVYPDGRRRYESTMGTESQLVPQGKAVLDRILLGRISPGVIGSCATCSQMARRILYERVGGFDSKLRRSEDTDFNIRLALLGGVFAGVAAPLVTQFMTMGSEKQVMADFDGYVAVLDKHSEYLRCCGWLHFHREWQRLRYAYLHRKTGHLMLRLLLLGVQHPIKLLQKLYWSVPSHQTLRSYRRWQHALLPGGQTGGVT